MKFTSLLCAALLISWLSPLAARAQSHSGTWNAQPSYSGETVQLELNYRYSSPGENENWNESDDVPYSQLPGISRGDFSSSGEHKSFNIVRDAGTFHADGWFAAGRGSGAWQFEPSANFRAQLQRRGVSGDISDADQFHLAMSDFHIATLDTLVAAGFERPDAHDLVRMVEHGVSDRFISAMRGLSFSPKNVEGLIRLRDHGVSAEYIRTLANAGYNVSAEEATRLRDHGVSTGFIGGLQRLGYHPGVDDLVRLADHGVSIAFIQRMRAHGYTHLSADDLIRLRDHGF